MLRNTLIAVAFVPFLWACAGDPATRATATLAAACDTYATVLNQLTLIKSDLSAETITQVNRANATVKPLCSTGSVVDPAAAVATVQSAIALINRVKGE